MTKILTTDEVAAKMNVKRRTVQTWIADGKLKATKWGRDWIVTQSDLDAFRENYQKNKWYRG